MTDQPEIVGIRSTKTTEIRIISQTEWDALWLSVSPVQRRQEAFLPVPAVLKDDVYYIAQGGLEWTLK